ncbi:MAG: hypothetical protein HRU04_13185 [Oceanospirillaceae bacterium]|nr:hypothetical protein [Oceanospirillaceae bacterium]
MNILYLVHDLSDPAVKRRVDMLRSGGADVRLAGFSRSAWESYKDGVCLGYTKDGAFIQRLIMVLICCIKIGRLYRMTKGVDVLIARNLEMLILARLLTNRFHRHNKNITLVFECLDIHRLLTLDDFKSSILVAVERWLVKSSKLVITSSPAFIKNYFGPIAKHRTPYLLLENKLFYLKGNEYKNVGRKVGTRQNQDENSWTIGWYGVLRCQKSLDLLDELCDRFQGKIKIKLRGRPAYTEFRDFDSQVNNSPHMSFLGEYQYPDDLSELYSTVDFTWAIDFFEEGGNSEWLLPNRIYEGGAFNTVPLYIISTQIAKKLKALSVGVGFDRDNALSDIKGFFVKLDKKGYLILKSYSENIPVDKWVADNNECVKLVSFLDNLKTDQKLSTRHIYEL